MALADILAGLAGSACDIGTSSVAFLIAFIALVVVVLHQKSSRENYPPGPTRLPFIGTLHHTAGRCDRIVFQEMAKQYGEMFMLHMGSQKVLVLNTYDVIKDAFLKHADVFSGRPQAPIDVHGLNTGILRSEGCLWKENRRFALRHLRDFGFGKLRIERDISTEIGIFVGALKSKGGKPFDLQMLLANAVSNVICSLVFSQRYVYYDKEFTELIEALVEYEKVSPSRNSFDAVFPLLQMLPSNSGSYHKNAKYKTFIRKVLDRRINEHKQNTKGESVDNLLDAYLEERKKLEKESTAITGTIFEDRQLSRTMYDFFAAGTQTTSSTLRWALIYLIHNPDAQDRVRVEVDSIYGRDEQPSYTDRDKLPFTMAVLTEAQRLGNISPLGVPHRVTADTVFHGFTIPMGTTVFANLTAAHLNEADFKNPNDFKPKRYLDEHGNFDKQKTEKVIPFGIGKRVCLGESLARVEVYLFFTTMVREFYFKLPDGAPLPSLEGSLLTGSIRHCLPVELCAVPR